MEPQEYKTLYESEDDYWWFVGLRKILLDSFSRFKIKKRDGFLVADIGCGTGGNLSQFCKIPSTEAFGCDADQNALIFLKKRGLQNSVACGSINAIPFSSSRFDSVFCIDVLECDSVREVDAICELKRILAESGTLFLLVPAYNWLKSPQHHAAVHASRRYTKSKVKHLLSSLGFKIKWSTYLFPTLFPMIALYRIFLIIFRSDSIESKSEISRLPSWINWIFLKIVEMENQLLKIMTFGWGSSILLVAEKE